MSGTYEYPAEVVYARNEERRRLREVAEASRAVLYQWERAAIRAAPGFGVDALDTLGEALARLDGEPTDV